MIQIIFLELNKVSLIKTYVSRQNDFKLIVIYYCNESLYLHDEFNVNSTI